MNIRLIDEHKYLCEEYIEIIIGYLCIIDIITISKINSNLYKIYNKKIPNMVKNQLEKRIKELLGNPEKLFSYIKENGDVITGSIILQVLYGEKYENTDIDICCYRRKLFQEIPEKTEYETYTTSYGREYTLSNLNEEGYSELKDRYWPKILGHCNSTNQLNDPFCLAREEIMRTFGIKIFDVSVDKKITTKIYTEQEHSEEHSEEHNEEEHNEEEHSEEHNEEEHSEEDNGEEHSEEEWDEEYTVKQKVYNFLMLEDDENNDQDFIDYDISVDKNIYHISNDFDMDVCANAFFMKPNGKVCLFLKNYNNILQKTTFINNVITKAHLIRHVYCVSSNNINFEKHIKDIPLQLHKRLLKYINRGFKIINNYDSYVTSSLDSYHLLKNYPLELFYQEANYYLQLYKLLPSILTIPSDIDILLNISKINPNLSYLHLSTDNSKLLTHNS